ncbi:MAG: S41 family peptidase, partial [Phycisphaerales bacterium]|nr:S41 family peptidase [Phycisphaerales bacterium]
GNGAMAKYDEFSAIIWPDEIARFERMTRGNFRGVGVQIQLDEESQMIKVVTPLEGTPAQRAGIRAGDLIKKIDGQSAVGISLNQAVDLITGPVDSGVTITMERKSGDDPDGKQITQDIDFKLARAIIPLASVKGWKRVGAKEDDWDYFIDPANRIGYVRLLQFTEDTTKDLRNAVNQMRAAQGGGAINGLILDLRYNPGGLLTEAVSVSNSFIDKGLIVSTRGPRVAGEEKQATPGNVLLKDVPMVVLINEGSASASEIVSGAIRHYADVGELRAVVIGQRSFGKGSVQNVWPIAQRAQMKLTTQYYYLPDGRRLHRTPGATVWGVDPHLKVDTLLETDSEALRLRQDADVLPIDQKGEVVVDSKTPRPDPNKLLTDGLDIQLQTALAVLQSQAIKGQALATQPREPQRTPN